MLWPGRFILIESVHPLTWISNNYDVYKLFWQNFCHKKIYSLLSFLSKACFRCYLTANKKGGTEGMDNYAYHYLVVLLFQSTVFSRFFMPCYAIKMYFNISLNCFMFVIHYFLFASLVLVTFFCLMVLWLSSGVGFKEKTLKYMDCINLLISIHF